MYNFEMHKLPVNRRVLCISIKYYMFKQVIHTHIIIGTLSMYNDIVLPMYCTTHIYRVWVDILTSSKNHDCPQTVSQVSISIVLRKDLVYL